jgi:hypothetical protein
VCADTVPLLWLKLGLLILDTNIVDKARSGIEARGPSVAAKELVGCRFSFVWSIRFK